jgi:hypothetical protein
MNDRSSSLDGLALVARSHLLHRHHHEWQEFQLELAEGGGDALTRTGPESESKRGRIGPCLRRVENWNWSAADFMFISGPKVAVL